MTSQLSALRPILHLPHSATAIPAPARADLLLDDEDLGAELLAMTDHLTEQLFELEGSTRIIFPVSRLVVDPERFPDDDREPMAARGMGVIYERTSNGRRLRERPSADRRQELLRTYYFPHHERLAAAVEAGLAAAGRALIFDCHSFPSVARDFELDPMAPRPDVNLGTDGFHTPPGLVETMFAAAREQGLSVLVDRPYRGTLVPAGVYRHDARVSSVMIEVNRRLYLDEARGRPGAGFEATRRALSQILAAGLGFALTDPKTTGGDHEAPIHT